MTPDYTSDIWSFSPQGTSSFRVVIFHVSNHYALSLL
jgi:hypothetical protein